MLPLVLVPGYMLDEALWDAVRAPLAAAMPLHEADLRAGDSIEAMARHVLAGCPPRFALLGFSMGGYVAREIVRMAPERVEALVLVATSSRADTAQQIQQRTTAAGAVPAGPFRGLGRAAIVHSLHPAQAGNAALVAQIRTMGERLGKEVFIRQSLVQRAADTARLHEIRCRTLVLSGAQDQMRSAEEACELAEGIPGAELRVVEDSGHMIPLEQPAALAALLLDWLAHPHNA